MLQIGGGGRCPKWPVVVKPSETGSPNTLDTKAEQAFTDGMNRPLIGVIAVVVIIASVVSIILTQRRPTARINLLPFEGCGIAGAAETAKLLNGRGRILVVTYKRVEPVGAASRAFAKEMTKHAGIQIVATEAVEFEEMTGPEMGGISAEIYFQWLNQHPGLDAIVSFVGTPNFSEADLRRLPRDRPRFIVLQGYGPNLRDLLLNGLVDLAVVPRMQTAGEAQDQKTEPKTAMEWFQRYYAFATPNDAEQLPIF